MPNESSWPKNNYGGNLKSKIACSCMFFVLFLSIACGTMGTPGENPAPSATHTVSLARETASPGETDATATDSAPTNTSNPPTESKPPRDPIPGIDIPIKVEGVSIKVYKVERVDEWEGYTSSTGDKLLVVYVDIVSGKIPMIDVGYWTVYLEDDLGMKYPRAGSMAHTDDSPDEASEAEWVFRVKDEDTSFIFHIAGGTGIPLDIFLE
jgi:hypothetical protein